MRISSGCALIIMIFGILMFGMMTLAVLGDERASQPVRLFLGGFSGLCTLGFIVSADALWKSLNPDKNR